MIELEEITQIGFGAYRVEKGNSNHYNALFYALKEGCNLVETSSNYRGGRSEQLIGDVLYNNPQLTAFIISKTGYVHNDELESTIRMHSANSQDKHLIKISEKFYYSLSPKYLEIQFENSRKRLRRKTLDAYLLHNPENYLKGKSLISDESFYDALRSCFIFLEEQVEQGKLRFYGISSNVIHFWREIDLRRVLKIVNEITDDNHFKIVEFPFNLIENEAVEYKNNNGQSLIEFAMANDLKIISNRPFNALTKEKGNAVNLVSHIEPLKKPKRDTDLFENLVYQINIKLQAKDESYNAHDFEVIQFLDENWLNIESLDGFRKIFFNHFDPLIATIFENKIPPIVQDFKAHVEYRTKQNVAQFLKNLMKNKGFVKTKEPLSLELCKSYLEQGVSSVLVGMRHVKYVDEMKKLFIN